MINFVSIIYRVGILIKIFFPRIGYYFPIEYPYKTHRRLIEDSAFDFVKNNEITPLIF
jgi:hypothetical protein